MYPTPENEAYLSYGLGIRSFVPLEGLITSDMRSDVVVREGSVRDRLFYKDFDERQIVKKPDLGLTVRGAERSFCAEWKNIGACMIEDGTCVTVEPNLEAKPQDIAAFITGPILGILLHQRNYLVLHASAVDIEGVAVVFLGNKGYGKSTLAAHLQARGHHLISDDLVPVRFSNGSAETLPGHPRIRLFPDSVEAVGQSPDGLPRVNSAMNKRYIDVSSNFSTGPIKIGCIFILEHSDRTEIADVNPSAAFMDIANNCYMGGYLRETDRVQLHFWQCQELLSKTRVARLKRPFDYKHIPEQCQLIEELVAHNSVQPVQ